MILIGTGACFSGLDAGCVYTLTARVVRAGRWRRVLINTTSVIYHAYLADGLLNIIHGFIFPGWLVYPR